MTSFPGNIYLIFFFFQARLTYVIAEIAPKTAWKINLRVFEILWWIRQGCQLEPMFICFLTVGGIRVMLTQKVFVLSSVTDIMKGFLLQLVRNRTNLKQLCTLISSEIKKSMLVSLPSNMFHNLQLWHCVLCDFLKIIIFTEPESKCFTSRLAFGSATCPARLWAVEVWLVVSGWGMHIIFEWIGRAPTAEKRAWCSVK